MNAPCLAHRDATSPRRRLGSAALLTCVIAGAGMLGASGCNTVGAVTRPDVLAALKTARAQPPSHKRLVVKDENGGSVRLGPRSRLRFELAGGMVTEWVRARELRTSDVGVTVGTELLATWNEIRLAEIENLSGPKVLAGVVAVAAAVAIVAALFASKGGKSGKKSKVSGSSGSRSSRRARARRSRPVRRRHYYRHRPRRARVGIAIGLSVPVGTPPPRAPGPTATRSAGPEEVPTKASVPLAASKPLFSTTARRRSAVRFFGAGSVGTDLRETNGLVDSLAVGVRLAELVELGGGFRHMLVDHPELSASGALASTTTKTSSYLGFLRAGLNIDLDAGRYVAVPVSIDVGFGDAAKVQWRLNWGLRVRPTDWLWIGIYPFSPTYTNYRATEKLATAKKWSFPTSLEVGFAF
jgi:hypothetical protein